MAGGTINLGSVSVDINANIRDFDAGIRSVTQRLKDFQTLTQKAQVAVPASVQKISAAYEKQQNVLSRLTDRVRALQATVQQSALTDSQKAQKIQELTNLEQKLDSVLGRRKINQAQLGEVTRRSTSHLAALSGEIKKLNTEAAGRKIDAQKQAMSEFTKTLQIALGPLSGVASRFQAIASLSSLANLQIAALVGTSIALGAAFAKGTMLAIDYEAAMVKVVKTTNLTANQVSQLSKAIVELSNASGIGAVELLDIAAMAGQLGVRGAKDLTAFTDTVAKLTRTTNLTGEEASNALARILNVTNEPVSNIKTLGSVVTALGNNFAASEVEIVRMTNEVARAVGIFGVASTEAAALGTAMRAAGVRAEAGGSAVGRMFILLQEAARSSGEAGTLLAKITNMPLDQFKNLFNTNAARGFEAFIKGLANVEGGSERVIDILNSLGITGVENAKALLPLINNANLLSSALNTAEKEANSTGSALDTEFNAALNTTRAQLDRALEVIKNFAKNIGKDFLPIITSLAKGFADLAHHAELVGKILEGIAIIIGSIAIFKIIGLVLKGILAAAKFITAMGTKAVGAKTAIHALNRVMDLLGIAVGLAGAAFHSFSKDAENATKKLHDFRDELDTLKGETDPETATVGLAGLLSDINAEITAQEERIKGLKLLAGKSQTQAIPGAGNFNIVSPQAKKELEDAITLLEGLKGKAAQVAAQLKNTIGGMDTIGGGQSIINAMGTEVEAFANKLIEQKKSIDASKMAVEAFSASGQAGFIAVTAEAEALAKNQDLVRLGANEGSTRLAGLLEFVNKEWKTSLKNSQDLIKFMKEMGITAEQAKAQMDFSRGSKSLADQTKELMLQNALFGSQASEIDKATSALKLQIEIEEAGGAITEKQLQQRREILAVYNLNLQTARELQAAEEGRLDMSKRLLDIQAGRATGSARASGGEPMVRQQELLNDVEKTMFELGERFRYNQAAGEAFANSMIAKAQELNPNIMTLRDALIAVGTELDRQDRQEFYDKSIQGLTDENRLLQVEHAHLLANNVERETAIALEQMKLSFAANGQELNAQQLMDLENGISKNVELNESLVTQRKVIEATKAISGQFLFDMIRGTDTWQQSLLKFLNSLTDMLLQLLVIQPLVDEIANSVNNMGKGGGSGGSGNIWTSIIQGVGMFASMYAGGAGGGVTASQAQAMGSVPMPAAAKGLAFNHGNIIPFARGGIVGGPTMFPMSHGRSGLMGEAGPEAIMPLMRGPGGKLGVAAEGGGGTTIVIDVRNTKGTNELEEAIQRGIARAAPFLVNASVTRVQDKRRRNPRFFGGGGE